MIQLMTLCTGLQCLTPVKILHMFHIDDDDDASDISQLDFVHMCPTIVYQLDAHLCHPEIHVGCHAESINRRQHCRSYHGLLDADRHQQRHSERRRASPSFTDLTGTLHVVTDTVGKITYKIKTSTN